MFVNLHVHTSKGSLLDSILTVDQMVKFAKENGQKAIAVTDHGSMSSFVDLVKACIKNGITPIIGCEIYEVDDMGWKEDSKEFTQPRYHLCLLSRTQKGFKNLLKIVSLARTEGLYKKPRIDLNTIEKNGWNEGLICMTACQAGRLSRLLTNGKVDEAMLFYNRLKELFDEVYVEIQSHVTDEQIHANKLIHKFAKSIDAKEVITTDAHMLSGNMSDSHGMFVEIGEGREVGESYVDCYLQTENEVYEKISHSGLSKDEIDNILCEMDRLVDSIEDIDIGLNNGNQMPKIQIDSGFETHEEYLRYLCYKTFDEKFGGMSEEEQQKRRDRIEMELDVLYYVDYTDYFIMSYMIAKECDKRGIPRGYGRGSAGGCLCLFMLNVTQIDSVRFDLDFSRFANKGRKSMAD